MEQAVRVYKLTQHFPNIEQFGLVSQINRAATSIPANIAEGHGRDSTKEFIRHLSIARGSLAELETHLILANKLGYIDREDLKPIWEQYQSIGKRIGGLMRSLRKKLKMKNSPVASPQSPAPVTKSP